MSRVDGQDVINHAQTHFLESVPYYSVLYCVICVSIGISGLDTVGHGGQCAETPMDRVRKTKDQLIIIFDHAVSCCHVCQIATLRISLTFLGL
jgi:hypothetical protein